MHFKQLEAFVNVIKFKSFSKAAEEIYLSQPTISAHISALENEFGTKLIIRSTKEVYPSKAGKVFYEYASEMLKMRDKAILSVKSSYHGYPGHAGDRRFHRPLPVSAA